MSTDTQEPAPGRPPAAKPDDAPTRAMDGKLDSLGLMAGGIAHDFNNHLLAILGNADLLAAELAPDSAGSVLLGEIRTAAERAARLCTQLQAFAGKGRFAVAPVDLNATVRGMVPMLQTAVARHIALRLEVDPEAPLVDADVPHLQQAVMNLVVNAAESLGAQAGAISLRTGRSDGLLDAGAVAVLGGDGPPREFGFLEVVDSGPGMDRGVLERAFDPFYSTKVRGRGLGLASVLGIMRGHHGRLSVRTLRGEGTGVRLCFPASTLASAAAVPPAWRNVGAAGRRVLVVDDDELVRALCQRMLRRLGCDVVLAADGPAALAIFDARRGRIDLVLLDLILPGMDGVEVLGRLAALDPRVPVVMTSGYHEREISHRFGDQGVAGFLQKPYVLDDLAALLDRVFLRAAPAPDPAG